MQTYFKYGFCLQASHFSYLLDYLLFMDCEWSIKQHGIPHTLARCLGQTTETLSHAEMPFSFVQRLIKPASGLKYQFWETYGNQSSKKWGWLILPF